MEQIPVDKKTEETVPEKTAKIDITVTDDGFYGFHSCGNCLITLDGYPPRCPNCGIKLEGTYITPSFGGSDF